MQQQKYSMKKSTKHWQTFPVSGTYMMTLIYGKTEKEHSLALTRVLEHLQDCRLTLNLQKCIFVVPKMEFFWVIISAQEVAPTQDQTTTLLKATRQTTMAEVKVCQTSPCSHHEECQIRMVGRMQASLHNH